MLSSATPLPFRAFDRINQRTYASRGALRQFGSASGWLEPGERLAIQCVANRVRNGAILDVGIGGGRTAPLMLEISRNYRGIDYSPEMIRVARARFPELQIVEMDARKLLFGDASFDLVTFSFNGIDSVDPGGRSAILGEVHRVLRPGGFFVFSALNRDGTAYRERWPDFRVFAGASHSLSRVVRGMGRFVVGGVNWLRFHLLNRADADAAVSNISAHNFGLITVFMSVGAQLRQLRARGFEVEAIFEAEGGRIVTDGTQTTRAPWCHFVARKLVNAP